MSVIIYANLSVESVTVPATLRITVSPAQSETSRVTRMNRNKSRDTHE